MLLLLLLTDGLTGMLTYVHSLFMHTHLVLMDPKQHGPTVNIIDIVHYLLKCGLQLRSGHRRLAKSLALLFVLYCSSMCQVRVSLGL